MGRATRHKSGEKKLTHHARFLSFPTLRFIIFFRNFAALNTRRLAALIANKVTLFIRLHNLCRP